MIDKLINKKEPDYGITTGTAATAAAIAAFKVLNKEVNKVKIETPIGKLDIDIENSQKLTDIHGRASVIKRSYHDPDVTRNLKIFADVKITDTTGLIINGGEGVGLVTKPGLQISVGEPAINPIPKKMIRSNLESLLPQDKGVEVIISVPGGEKVAANTLNPRLGIIGGISILGTTGLARSMNWESYQKSFKCQLDVAVAEKYKELVFVPGNIGDKIAQNILDVDDDQIIQMGNLVGYMLHEASKANIEHLILLGHAGKIIKIAAGIFNTEHRTADGRREIISTHAALQNASAILVNQIYHSNTTEEMIDLLDKVNLIETVFNSIAKAVNERCQDKYHGELDVVIVKMDGTVLNSNHHVSFKN
jgi:cobalt-precorrin-5B (C1)-methyltransferase